MTSARNDVARGGSDRRPHGSGSPRHVHPYRIAVRGGSADGRGEIVDRLVEELARDLKVGHLVRSEATGSSPTDPLAGAVVRTRVLEGGEQSLASRRGEPGLFETAFGLLDCDVVVEEGGGEEMPAILFVDDAPLNSNSNRIIATAGDRPPGNGAAAPHFGRHDVRGLAEEVRSHLDAKSGSVPLYGLVLAGGQSSRMGRPKWALEYHGEPQALVLHRLLSAYCDEVFVSLREEQSNEEPLGRLPVITDRFLRMGPLGGILSAMSSRPQAAWLVLACDLPFVSTGTLRLLLDRREPLRFATAFVSPHDGLPEPLCAVYEPKSRLRLFQSAALGYDCPRKMLMNARVGLIECPEPQELTNANEPGEYQQALARLGREGQP